MPCGISGIAKFFIGNEWDALSFYDVAKKKDENSDEPKKEKKTATEQQWK